MDSNQMTIKSLKGFDAPESLLKQIRRYLRKSSEIQLFLKKNPEKWWMFQDEFNVTLDGFSKEIGFFEKAKSEKMFYKLKNFFIKHLRKYFTYGHYTNWSLKKPYGYAGDFQIIEDIYNANPSTIGYERLWDNYFLHMGPSIATRNRKEDFKRIISNFLIQRGKQPVRIMDLASGPCRELRELFDFTPDVMRFAKIDCYDFDDYAIAFASKIFQAESEQVSFYKKNAIKMALKKNIKDEIPQEYDLIFSTGLFDYLDERVAVRLISNLRKTLKPGGIICISNYWDKEKNLWAPLMEWVAEWNLIHRSQDEFIKLFTDSGFELKSINFEFEPLMIMQYCMATH
jgi:SAM-dependent methyltransferase